MSSGDRVLAAPRTPSHVRNHTPTHVGGNSRTPTHDVSNYCTLSRKPKKNSMKKKSLDKSHSGSHEDLFTGMKVSKVPESEKHIMVSGDINGRRILFFLFFLFLGWGRGRERRQVCWLYKDFFGFCMYVCVFLYLH